MRLTVGPLPPAVYWRRRAVILGTLLLLVLVLVYSCSDASDAARRKRVLTPTTASPSGSPSTPVFTPSGGLTDGAGGDPAVGASPSAAATSTPAAPDAPAQTGPCTDAEMAISAVAEPGSAARGAFVRFTLRIRNISDRSCTRDVGADPQELYVQDGSKVKVWSSDTCNPLHGTDVRTFKPNDVAEFYVVWNGKANNAGCTNQQPPPAGTYQLVGRLATKLSEPGPLELK
jgi:hypothetical protein